MTCVFSRLIPVLTAQVDEDLDLNNSYYIMIGMGEDACTYVYRLEYSELLNS